MAGALPDTPAARVDLPVTYSPWSGVVAIKTGGGVFSGVLIADRYVLTAAHVASGAVENPAALEVQFNLPEGAISISASRVDVFPGYSFPYDDLALIQLSSDAPGSAKRYTVLDTTVVPATVMKLVGYGASGNGDTGTTLGSNPAVRRVGENALDVMQSAMDKSGRSSTFYLYDFDGPTGQGSMGGGTLGNTRESMVAVGDSGSPAFISRNNQYLLMGINNFAADFSGGTTATTYKFGNGGGGMCLSDPRFISWLRQKSDNTMRTSSDAETTSKLPVPVWAGALVSSGFLVALRIRKRRQSPRS